MQYSKVTYLGCELDENLSGEAMALKVMNKINDRLSFLYRKIDTYCVIWKSSHAIII